MLAASLAPRQVILSLPDDPFAGLQLRPQDRGHSYVEALEAVYRHRIKLSFKVQLGLTLLDFEIVDEHNSPMQVGILPRMPSGARFYIVQILRLTFDSFSGRSVQVRRGRSGGRAGLVAKFAGLPQILGRLQAPARGFQSKCPCGCLVWLAPRLPCARLSPIDLVGCAAI